MWDVGCVSSRSLAIFYMDLNEDLGWNVVCPGNQPNSISDESVTTSDAQPIASFIGSKHLFLPVQTPMYEELKITRCSETIYDGKMTAGGLCGLPS